MYYPVCQCPIPETHTMQTPCKSCKPCTKQDTIIPVHKTAQGMSSLKTSSWTSATVFQQLAAIKIDTDSSLTGQIVKKGVSVRRLCVDNFLLPLTARLRGWGLLLPASMDICMLYISVHWHHGSSSVLVFNTRKTLFVMFPTPPWML